MKTIIGRNVLFLLYDSRSGSTLLARLLDEFEDIGVTVESNFMINLLRKAHLFKIKTNLGDIFDAVWKLDRFQNLQVQKKNFLEAAMKLNADVSLQGFVTTLLHVYFQKVKPQAVAWVVKDGANGYFMKQITKGLPDARFIHIIRDGRAVLNSRMQSKMPYGKGETMSRDPLTSARLWKSFVKNIDSFKKLQPKRLIEIRYEDLVAHPDTQLVQLRRFLSLPEMGFKKEEDLGYYDRIASKEKNIHKLVAMPPQVNRADSWVRELPDGYRKVFEYAAGSTLKAKGYVDVGQYGLFDVLKNLATLKILISSTIKRIVGWFCYLLNPELLRKVLKQKIMAHIEKRL